jgi:hypothetical protein
MIRVSTLALLSFVAFVISSDPFIDDEYAPKDIYGDEFDESDDDDYRSTGYDQSEDGYDYGKEYPVPSATYYDPTTKSSYPSPEPSYPTPEPSFPTPHPSQPTPAPTDDVPYEIHPQPFVAPEEESYGPAPAPACDAMWKPNSAKYMAYVCSSLYASASTWAENNCKAYYTATNDDDDKARYQAHLCTYWSQRSVMRVVTACFIEAHLRNEFIMKYGKAGTGKWWCEYTKFVNQVNDCYSSSLHYYPLGASLNSLEHTVASLNPPAPGMPPFTFTGSSVAMCAFYNKNQVYNRAS